MQSKGIIAAAAVAFGLAVPGLAAADVDDLAAPACTGEDCTVSVRLQHTFELVTPLASSLIGPIDFVVETTMPLERLHSDP